MTVLHTTLVMLAAFLAVFLEASAPGVRHFLGAQVDLLPALTVYAALNTNLTTLALLAVGGGLFYDTLSVNPLGLSILPLFAVGFLIYLQREFILREQRFAQSMLGLGASAVVPALSMLLLLTMGRSPSLGWGSLWQWIVMSLGGAVATPALFLLFNRLNHALGYRPIVQTSFRPDREIRRRRRT
jgi:rod shape-determining protein MreD